MNQKKKKIALTLIISAILSILLVYFLTRFVYGSQVEFRGYVGDSIVIGVLFLSVFSFSEKTKFVSCKFFFLSMFLLAVGYLYYFYLLSLVGI